MSGGLDRRQFLKGAAAATTAGYLVTRGRAIAQNEANSRVVVGVMGLSRGKSLADRFGKESGIEVRYLCDVDKDRLAAGTDFITKSTEQKPKPVDDFRRILDDSEIDALICAAPNHWHAPATILACSAGKHCYVEKPCSHNPAEGELMVEAARKYKRCVQMGTQRRSSEPITEGMQRMWDGVIGRVYHANSWYGNARGSIGRGKPAPVPETLNYDLWQGPAPRVPYYDNRIHYNWHWFWHWGNGELGNNGVHSLDLCRWGLQVDFPIRVTSAGGRYRFDDDQQTPDTHNVAYEFEGKKSISWDGMSCNRHRNAFVTFYGETGALVIEGGGNVAIYNDVDKLVDEIKGNQGDVEHIDNFVTCIRNDTPMKLNQEIESGHRSTLLCHLGNIAHRTGRSLTCSSKDGHILGDEKAMALWKREYEPGWEPKI
ncbi:gfo/Idh/MocA family oxidoreductase [bacterium]|nr:gfo/Idh/MocA family oxidoreductase [bacterium]